MSTTLDTAAQLIAAGINVVPVAEDGTKRPLGAWKKWQTTPQDPTHLDGWATPNGVGVITGSISGNLEMLEIEGRAADRLTELTELANASGLEELWNRISSGWLELSPSGGIHWFYRLTTPVPGNTKIASDANHLTLIETRGEGGFVVVAPSSGRTHETGEPWKRLQGGPDTIPTLTDEERTNLHTLLSTLDERPTTAPEIADTWKAAGPTSDLKAGDDYEARTDWGDILTPHGWAVVARRGNERYWRRPGKKIGISASTGRATERDRLYVFTTSTEFAAETPYTKFGAYALLEHGGDYTAAARTLSSQGFGQRAERHLTTVPNHNNIDGTAALQPVTITPDPEALTDNGNAELMVARHARRLRYVTDAGRWAVWDDTRWRWDDDDAAAIRAAIDTIQAIPDDSPTLHKHIVRSLSHRSLAAAARIARAHPDLRVAANVFDARPNQLNTPNGVIDLDTGTLATPHPTLFHTKSTGTTYSTDQPTPQWDRFLNTTFGGDMQMIRYVQQLAGITAYGTVTAHVLPFLHGSGANGKSVFLSTLTRVLGDYALEAPNGFLIAGRNQHETELARLQGRRLVIASEINQDTKFDEAKVKLLTGGDTIAARFMRQDYFEFTPTHTLWLMGNHQPKVSTGGHSFWRRLRLIPFAHTVPDSDRIENLQERLTAEEGPGILRWIVDGALSANRDGLDEPTSVTSATRQYEQEEDHLARFIADRIHIGGGAMVRVDTADVRRAYADWCRDQGETELNTTAFGREFKTRTGSELTKSNGRRFYNNISLYVDESNDVSTHWNDR